MRRARYRMESTRIIVTIDEGRAAQVVTYIFIYNKKGEVNTFPFLFAIVLRESQRSERNASGVAKPPYIEL